MVDDSSSRIAATKADIFRIELLLLIVMNLSGSHMDSFLAQRRRFVRWRLAAVNQRDQSAPTIAVWSGSVPSLRDDAPSCRR